MKDQFVHHGLLSDVPDQFWQNLLKKRIYFGHQSVGYNIIDGIIELIKEFSIKLQIEETIDLNKYSNGLFSHGRIGRNQEPRSKIEMFSNVIKEIEEIVDIAFFKFCYVDFNENTNIKKLFHLYKYKMDELQNRYPDISFYHFTVPLVVKQTGPKSWIKKTIRRPIIGIEDNIKRHEFNMLMRKNYAFDGMLFDIARVESTDVNCVRHEYFKNGIKYDALVPKYTNDGGHLNKNGRRIVVEKLLLFLVKSINMPQTIP